MSDRPGKIVMRILLANEYLLLRMSAYPQFCRARVLSRQAVPVCASKLQSGGIVHG